jgi:hypothetical protein
MNSFKKETKGDRSLLFYVFLHENVDFSKGSIFAAEQQLTREKLI